MLSARRSNNPLRGSHGDVSHGEKRTVASLGVTLPLESARTVRGKLSKNRSREGGEGGEAGDEWRSRRAATYLRRFARRRTIEDLEDALCVILHGPIYKLARRRDS